MKKKHFEKELNKSLKLFSQSDFNDDKNPLNSIENFLEYTNIVEIYNYKNKRKRLFNIKLSFEIKIYEAKKYIIKAAIKNRNINENDINYSFVHLFTISNKSFKKIENLMIQFSEDARTVSIEKVISINKCQKCIDVLNAFKSSFSKEETLNDSIKELFNENNFFRYLIVLNGKIERIVNDDDFDWEINKDEILRIEIVPENQKKKKNKKNSELLKVFFSNVDFHKTLKFGQPFLFDISYEYFSETKIKLQNFMILPESESNQNFNFYLRYKFHTFK